MPLHDFKCTKCDYVQEEIVPAKTRQTVCEHCGEVSKKVFLKSAVPFKTIVPTYPGCKRQKAGYVHTIHADQKATKIQSGYGGCVKPD